MKKFLSIILVVLLAITATVALVACDKNADDKWISLSDKVKDEENGKLGVCLYKVETDGITGEKIWKDGNWEKISLDDILKNEMPMNTYSLIGFWLKNVDKNEGYSKIKFTIEVEENTNLHLKINSYDLGVRSFSKGINNIELEYEKGMLLINSGVLLRFYLKNDAEITKWNVNNIKLLPIEE